LSQDRRQGRTARQSLAIEQEIGNRAGEAATWEALATLEFKEGNYPAAKEKFGKAIRMLQDMDDRAGEASAWKQLGDLVWTMDKKHALQLLIVSYRMLVEIGCGETDQAGKLQGLIAGIMAVPEVKLELAISSREQKEEFIRSSCTSYLRDRGASLLREAFGPET
jgi:hypothetical protein